MEDLFRWALVAAKPDAVSHVLVAPSVTTVSHSNTLRLVLASSTYLGSAFVEEGRVLEQLPIQELSFIANCYLLDNQSSLPHRGGDSMNSAISVNRIAKFLVQCGVNRGPAMEVTARVLTDKEVRAQSAIVLRQSNTACFLHLPYNLGVFNRKHVYEVNVLLSGEWSRFLRSDLSVCDASSLVGIFASLLAACDCTNPASAESTPAAANLFKGRGTTETVKADTAVTTSQRISTAGPALPGLSRLYWLPPGQPGASSLATGPAQWIRSLAESRWIPAIPAGAPIDSSATQVLFPREVQLPSGALCSDIPVAKISPSVANLLMSAPAVVRDLLAWGTQKPKPPIEKLEQIASDLDRHGQTIPFGKVLEYYNELVGIWRIICGAQSENRLSSSEIRRIFNVCSGSTTASARCIIPGVPSGKLFPFNRCVAIDAMDRTTKDSDSEYCGERDKQYAAVALVQVDHLLNFNTNDSGHSWPLYDISKHLKSLLRPHSGATPQHGIEFLADFCDKRPSAVTPELRRAFSWALWLAIQVQPQMQQLSSSSGSTTSLKGWAATEIAAAQRALQAALPRLHIYCRKGLELYPDVFRSQWLPAYRSLGTTTIPTPVLIDDVNSTNKSGHNCGSMLLPKHGFQPIAVLNHCALNPACAFLAPAELTRLVHIDSILLQVLDIPRTSEAKQFSLKVSVRGQPKLLYEPTQRLQAVALLLQMLQNQFHSISDRKITANLWSAPKLVKYNSLQLKFTTPKTVSTADDSIGNIVVNAIWGPVSEGDRPLFVAGDADDYAAEIEGLVLSAICSHYYPHQPPPSLQWPAKVLHLLHHLEDGEKFLKYLHRDFSPFFEQEEDRLPSDDTTSHSNTGSGGSSDDSNEGMKMRTLLQDSFLNLLEIYNNKGPQVAESSIRLCYRCHECKKVFSKWKKCFDHIAATMHNSYKVGQVLKPSDYCYRVEAVSKDGKMKLYMPLFTR